MKIFYLIWGMLSWSYALYGQHDHIIDLLFEHPTNNITTLKERTALSNHDYLKNNYGLSMNISIRNNGDILDNRGTAAISGKVSILSNGILQHRLDANIIDLQTTLNRVSGDQESISHNYGMAYAYITSLYNKQKAHLAKNIINHAKTWNEGLNELYYKKLIEYHEVSESENIIETFEAIAHTHNTINSTLQHLYHSYDNNLSLITTRNRNELLPEINFTKLADDIINDKNYETIKNIRADIIRYQAKKDRLPHLSASIGYDLWRQRPIAGLTYSMQINNSEKRQLQLNLTIDQERLDIEKLQRIKEISILQIEYENKLKQILQFDQKINESDRNIISYYRQAQVLNTSYKHDIHRTITEKQLYLYEIADLEMQALLVLLKVRSIIQNKRLSNYIITNSRQPTKPKSPQRYIHVPNLDVLSQEDRLSLHQNKLTPITSYISKSNVILVHLNKYQDRYELELYLQTIPAERIIVFDSIESFQSLELRSIRNQMSTFNQPTHIQNN